MRYRGHSIAEVLALSVHEALALFADQQRLAEGLGRLVEVGVGYLQLGQGAPTLSGGGPAGGKLVAEGTPEQVAQVAESATAQVP